MTNDNERENKVESKITPHVEGGILEPEREYSNSLRVAEVAVEFPLDHSRTPASSFLQVEGVLVDMEEAEAAKILTAELDNPAAAEAEAKASEEKIKDEIKEYADFFKLLVDHSTEIKMIKMDGSVKYMDAGGGSAVPVMEYFEKHNIPTAVERAFICAEGFDLNEIDALAVKRGYDIARIETTMPAGTTSVIGRTVGIKIGEQMRYFVFVGEDKKPKEPAEPEAAPVENNPE